MSQNEYNNFSISDGMFSNMSEDSSSSSEEEEDEYHYEDEFKEYINIRNIQTTQTNLLILIDNFMRETGFGNNTGFGIQTVYGLTPVQLQRYQLQQYNFLQDLINAYGYREGTEQYADLVTKIRLFYRNQLMFDDFIHGVNVNIGILRNLIAHGQRIQIPKLISRISYIEGNFEYLFEGEPRTELDYKTPSIPGIEITHTIPNSEFTDIDFRYCEFVAVKYFFLPEGNIIQQHPNIIKYQMNIIENLIIKLLNRIPYFYHDGNQFFSDVKNITNYRLTHPFIVKKENISITYYHEYLQLYVLMAMYRYLVTYNGVHIRREVFLDYMYEIEALLYTDVRSQQAMVLNYINFFKLKYLEQNHNN